MSMKKLSILGSGLAMAGLMACGVAVEDGPQEDASGIAAALAVSQYSDVTHMEYYLYSVDPVNGCPDDIGPGNIGDDNVTLVEGFPKQVEMKQGMTLPINIVDTPFKKDSEHFFADLLTYVDTGCYFIYVQPERTVKEDPLKKKPSKDCLPTYLNVEVDGAFTEVVLISQCPGLQEERGILDMITALNGPPSLDDFDIFDQKFVPCPEENGQEVVLCASATDPDNDPLRFIWSYVDESGETVIIPPEDNGVLPTGIAFVEDDVQEEEEYEGFDSCIRVGFEPSFEKARKFEFKVAVFDLLWNENKSAQITFEEWFAERNILDPEGEAIRSRDEQQFPVYVDSCIPPEELVCNQSFGYWKVPNGDDALVNEIWDAAGFTAFNEDAELLCEDEASETGIAWINILRLDPPPNAYERFARAYITAELNRGVLDINADPDWGSDETIGDTLDALLEAMAAILNDRDFCDPKDKASDNENPSSKDATLPDDDDPDAQDAIDAANAFAEALGGIAAINDILTARGKTQDLLPEPLTKLDDVSRLLNDFFNDELTCPADFPVDSE